MERNVACKIEFESLSFLKPLRHRVDFIAQLFKFVVCHYRGFAIEISLTDCAYAIEEISQGQRHAFCEEVASDKSKEEGNKKAKDKELNEPLQNILVPLHRNVYPDSGDIIAFSIVDRSKAR